MGVVIAGFTTTTLPRTTPALICSHPEDVAFYDYFNHDYFTIKYPANSDQVLRGSGAELLLPTDRPQEILLVAENAGFLELKVTVKHARMLTLTLTLTSKKTLKVQHPAAKNAVS